MVLKVSQAFILEFESDDEQHDNKEEQSTRSQRRHKMSSSQDISSINQNNNVRRSGSSTGSSHNFIDSLMNSLQIVGDLDKASIPQLREIERKILEQTMKINQIPMDEEAGLT